MHHTPKTPTFVLLAALIAAPALAQDASIRRRDSSASSGRLDTRSSFSREIEFRNAITTGNAPGGMSFRGDLGYTAPSAFRGELGSDALFAYRRDSLYSGLAGMGIRGTEALQYQFSLTTGSRPTSDLIGSPVITRLGQSGTTDAALPNRVDPSAPQSTRLSTRSGTSSPLSTRASYSGYDHNVTGTLRSTASHRASASLSPEIVSVFEQGIERERYGVVASPLLGLVSAPMSTRAQTASRIDARVGTSYNETVDRIRASAEELIERRDLLAQGINPDAPRAPERPEAPAATRPGAVDPLQEETPDTDDWIQESFEGLFEQLSDPDAQDETIPGVPTLNDTPANEPGDNPGTGVPEISLTSDPASAPRRSITIDPLTLELINSNTETVTYFINPESEGRDFYSEHVRAGQRLLTNGRYFDAEERFTRALAVKRSDVTAQIGRLHAQIGAGLVLSASVNLQSMLLEHPEIIAQRYGPDVIPTGVRADEIILTLQERTGLAPTDARRVPDPDRVKVAAAFVLAYMGYQRGDAAVTRDALGVVDELGEDAEARIADLLKKVWLAAPRDADPGPDANP